MDTGSGEARITFPGWDITRFETCSLVVARHRKRQVAEVAELMNFSIAYIEKVERQALAKLRGLVAAGELDVDLEAMGVTDDE
jgi:hypothetical protein